MRCKYIKGAMCKFGVATSERYAHHCFSCDCYKLSIGYEYSDLKKEMTPYTYPNNQNENNDNDVRSNNR